MDEGGGLENRCTCKRTVGSNPTPSAILGAIWTNRGLEGLSN